MMTYTEQRSLERLLNMLDTQPERIRWKDLVSNPRIRHSTWSREQLLQAGTIGHQAPPENLYHGWQRPWFFWTVLKIGFLLIAACFLAAYGCQLLLNTTTQVAVEMLYLIPPMVVPIVLMVFFWELNVPRNLTIWELLSFFLIGTLLSLGGNALMFVLFGTESGPMAAIREEPAKLLAGVALLLYCSKTKRKMTCGLTGLVIGAAVGSGFSAFETISYGLHNDLITVMLRVLFAIVGHTLYSCSYMAALALHSPNGKITSQSFFNADFLITFGCSVFCHAIWNTGEIPLFLRLAVTLVLLWLSALKITQKCLKQVRSTSTYPAPAGNSAISGGSFSHIELRCLRGMIAGQKWSSPCTQRICIGRGKANQICLPDTIRGISRNHCFLEARSNGWYITDTHSTYGTFLQLPGGSIVKLVPGKQYKLTSGALLYLGSQQFCLGISVF